MLIINEPKLKSKAFDSLLWLKRALEMLERFFSNILDDTSQEENLKDHIHAAYCVTLKQYHNWIIQKSFSVNIYFNSKFKSNRRDEFNSQTNKKKIHSFSLQVVYTLLPYRSQLLGGGDTHVENLQSLDTFLRPMREHLKHVNSLLIDD